MSIIIRNNIQKKYFSQKDIFNFFEIPPLSRKPEYSFFCIANNDGSLVCTRLRELIPERIQQVNLELYRDLHKRASKYYKELLFFSDFKQEDIQVEIAYHLLRFDEEEGMSYLSSVFEKAFDLFQLEFLHEVLETTQGLKLNRINKLWIMYYMAILKLVEGGYQEASDTLENIMLGLEEQKQETFLEDKRLKALTGYYLGMAYWYIGQCQKALTVTEQVQSTWESIHDEKANRILEIKSISYFALGLFDPAIDYGKKLLLSSRKNNDNIYEAWALSHIGRSLLYKGSYPEALDALQNSMSIWETLDSGYGFSYPIANLGHLFSIAGDYKQGKYFLEKSLNMASEEGSKEIEGFSLQRLAVIALQQENYTKAEQHIRNAFSISNILDYQYFHAVVLETWGQVLISQGKNKPAHKMLNKSLKIAETIQANYIVGESLVSLYKHDIIKNGMSQNFNYDKIMSFLLTYKYYDFISDIIFYRALELYNAKRINQAMYYLSQSLQHALLFNWYHLQKRISDILTWLNNINDNDKKKICSYIIRQWEIQSLNGILLKDIEAKSTQNRIENPHTWKPLLSQVKSLLNNNLDNQVR